MLVFLIFLAVFLFDQLSKLIVRRELLLGQSVAVIDGYFHLTYVANPGGAFGILPRGQALFVAVSTAVLVLLVVYYLRERPAHLVVKIALGLIAGGTAGNLVDRLRFGKVIDWLDFQVWPVFNIADSALVVGLMLMAAAVVLGKDKTAGP